MKTLGTLCVFCLTAISVSAQNAVLLVGPSWTLSEVSTPTIESNHKAENPSETQFSDTFTFSENGTVKIQNEDGVIQGRWTLDDTGRKLVVSTPEHASNLNLTISSISEGSLLATTLMDGQLVQLRFKAGGGSAK